ncbi:patatin-like phospholipase family protein [Flavobacterium sp.]|uniref:patatin-like phospholipase family protein n=1 Tax=Flavobacterium sp. TaxID=239 RepID=UPI0039E407A8
MKSLTEKRNRGEDTKRILALDGGGIRGILTLGMLKEIENQVKAKGYDKLCDYYDVMSGTSTGAIIASALSLGKTVDEVTQLYLDLGKEIFGKGRRMKILKRKWTISRAFLKENYSSKKIEQYLKDNLGEDILISNDTDIKCGLIINTKRADTYSLWTIGNHPNATYAKANAHFKLWELCRASSAAPYYFMPKLLHPKTSKGVSLDAVYIDGGLSLANSPAWQAFLAVTVPSFGFDWKSGKDAIYITSLGTGNGVKKEDVNKLLKSWGVEWSSKLSDLFMVDALEMNHVILETVGHNAGPKHITDSQYGDLSNYKVIKDECKLFTFERHNVKLTVDDLKGLGIKVTQQQVDSLKEMDYFENMDQLLEIGKAYAAQNIHSIL